MAQLGYRPVGRDFPVFLHPQTREEYALARTERKTARGYRGFQVHCSPEVTLEEDLLRRDLTINALARDEQGRLIDLFGGERDLQLGVLRHVSDAFTEDPVRVLRLARFAARFAFEIAPATLALLCQMVAEGEVDALVPERAWQEISQGLLEDHPALMLDALRSCGALARILPEVDALFGVPLLPAGEETDTGLHLLRVLDFAATRRCPLPVRFACLLSNIGHQSPQTEGQEARGERLAAALCERLRVPTDCRELARMAIVAQEQIHGAVGLNARALVDLFTRLDGFRRPERFGQLLLACLCDYHGRPGFEVAPYPAGERLRRCLEAARGVDSGAIARLGGGGLVIASAIDRARLLAVQQALEDTLQSGLPILRSTP